MAEELDFIQAAQVFRAEPNEKRSKLDKTFYSLLEKNAEMLAKTTELEEEEFSSKRGSRDNAARLSKILKAKQIRNFQGFTDDDDTYLTQVIQELDAGGIPKKITQKIYSRIEAAPELLTNPLKILALIKLELPAAFLNPTHTDQGKGRIILSEYFNAVE